jgi:hypothetical protein
MTQQNSHPILKDKCPFVVMVSTCVIVLFCITKVLDHRSTWYLSALSRIFSRFACHVLFLGYIQSVWFCTKVKKIFTFMHFC